MSWEDAQAFCRWLSEEAGAVYRLPSEAEWEFACRAGSTTRFSFGDDESRLGEHAWFSGNAGGKTHPVGEQTPNAFGLFDTHGNVWEWCQDAWNESYAGAPSNGAAWMSGDASRAALRGGSWIDIPQGLRSAYRIRSLRAVRFSGIGFRVVRTLVE